MKILMLSWEYPPKNVGGLSNHVYNLSQALINQGHEVYVITCKEGAVSAEDVDNGVFVRRVSAYDIDTEDFIKWVMHLNFAMLEEGIRLINKIGKVDIIHVHDWLAAYSGKALKWAFNIPMVCTIHATEYGRNNGIRTEMQRYICDVERMLTNEAWKVIVCSGFMRQQVSDILKCYWDKIWIIQNGIDLKEVPEQEYLMEFRSKFAGDDEKIVFFIGRHVFEKGIHLLVGAIPNILTQYEKVKFVIAGVGPMTEDLKRQVDNLGIRDKVDFVGYLDDDDRNNLYGVADVAVIPSLYEPFGIVALEAMEARCPLVVSDIGGLSEIIEHKKNGLKAIPGSNESLAHNILEILKNNNLAESLKTSAINIVKENYTWEKIGELTDKLYNEVKLEAEGTPWEVKTKKPRGRKSAETSKRSGNINENNGVIKIDEVAATTTAAVKRGRKKKATTAINDTN